MGKQRLRNKVCRIRRRRSYSMKELANLLRVHIRTVQNWRKKGMNSIDETQKPLLFLGENVRSYLKKRFQKRKCKIDPDQIYCLKCRTGQFPVDNSIKFECTGKAMGKIDQLVILRGLCSKCSSKVVRFGTTRCFSNGIWGAKFQQAQQSLYGIENTVLKTDFK